MLKKLLSDLDPKVQLGVSFASYGLALFCGIFGFGVFPTGPWWAAALLCVIAASLVSVGSMAWPRKLPEGLAEAKDRWEKSKDKATKTIAGKIFWKLGRSAIAAYAASFFVPVPMDGGFLKIALLAGFGLSTGFFGIQASAWTGTLVALVAHRVAASGLGVDFANLASRESFWIQWNSGAAISWWWPVGLGLSPLVWVGLAGAAVVVADKARAAAAEREAARIAREKIEGRRARLRERRERNPVDFVAEARAAAEKALSKVSGLASGDPGSVKVGKTPKEDSAPKELVGVEKIQRKISEAKLRQYAESARSLLRSEAEGIDTLTAARRSFDRVVLNLSDSETDILRKEPWAADLLTYYNKLCGSEASAASGTSDGDVVTTVAADPVDGWGRRSSAPLPIIDAEMADEVPELDLLDQQDEGDGDDTSETSPKVGVATDAADEVDELDHVATETAPVGRHAVGMKGLDMMLAQGASAAVNGQQTDLDQVRKDFASEDHIVGDTTVDVLEEVPIGSDLPTVELDGEVGDVASVEAVVDATSEDAHDLSADEAVAIETEEGVEALPEADTTSVDVAPEPLVEPEEAVGSTPAHLSVDDKKAVIGAILSNVVTRDMVLSSIDAIASADEAASILGVPVSIVSVNWPIYARKVDAAKAERELAARRNAGDLAGVKSAVETLKTFQDVWPTTEQLSEAEKWTGDAEEALRAEREEQERVERERAEREEAERLAAAEAKRIEDEARAESIRLAEQQRLAEEEARLAAEREEARAKELNERRHKVAIHIVMGRLTDDVLDDGMALFPTAEKLAEQADVPVEDVEAPFNAMALKGEGKRLFDQLALAIVDDANIDMVHELMRNREALEAYDHPDLKISDIEAYIHSVETKQRVVGLKERATPSTGPCPNANRSFMKKRKGMSDECADIVDTKLPQLLRKVKSAAALIDGDGDDEDDDAEVWRTRHARFVARAAEAAAVLVAHEKECREYVQAFLPSDVREGDDAWATVVKAAEAGTNVAPIAKSPKAATPAKAPESSEKPSGGLDLKRSLERVQQLDARHEVEMIPRTDLPERSSMENGYRITLGGKFGDKIETRSNPHKPVFEFFLTKDGRKDGCVRIWSHLGTMPVWYDADRDILFYLSEDGSIQERQGAELARMFERNMEETTEQGEEVRGLILSVPYLTTDGATSFEPWLEKIQKGPVIVVNTKQLNEDIISAFVDRITGA